MEKLGEALDRGSYEWLLQEHPDLATAIEEEVAGGAEPSDIKWFVLQHTQRRELALRCEQAARHLILEYEDEPVQSVPAIDAGQALPESWY